MKKRKLSNWLKGLLEYVEDTEAPRDYWLWGGLFTISAALQRKTWIDFGIDLIYPNLYICIVAPPGERKNAPIKLAKQMLEKLQLTVAVDSTSKRALTKELARAADREQFLHPDGKPRRMSVMAVPSKELASLFAIDKANMLVTLTDLWDCHDSWKYDTSDKGKDHLYNVCLQVIAATQPRYIATELPPEAFGEGFASRVLWVSEKPFYKSVPWPTAFDSKLGKVLLHDLNIIHQLIGKFSISSEARAYYDEWYNKIPQKKRELRDERLLGNLNRLHVQVLKVVQCLHVAESNELLISVDDMGRAIDYVEDIFQQTTKAFGGSGASRLGPFVDSVRNQISILRETTIRELMQLNYRDLTMEDLESVLTSLEVMGEIKRPLEAQGPLDQTVKWIKRKPE